MKHSFALLLPLAFACGVANAAAADAESDRAQIAALEQRWLAAIRGGDRHALGEILAKGFVDINTDGKMRERDEAIAHASAPPDTTQTIRQLKVRVFGDTAVANGINTVHSKAHGWTVEVAFTDVFMRERGVWRAVSAQETLRKPPAVPPSTH
jgi:ketosteroid isomerase-like protein